MGKSLGDYNIEQSSSQDIKNIKWTQKNPVDAEKLRKKKTRKISPTNIIYSQNTKEESSVQKNFKIEDMSNTEKSKNKKISKKHQNSALSNCKIEPGFRRPGR